MKKYPTRQSKKRVSLPSSTPKRSLLPGSFVMNVRSEDIVAEIVSWSLFVQPQMRAPTSWLSSNDSGGLLNQPQRGRRQPHAEHQQPAQQQRHGRNTIPRRRIAGARNLRRADQDARELFQDSAKRGNQGDQHERADERLARRKSAADHGEF